MTLLDYTLLSVSVASTLLSLVLLGALIGGVVMARRMQRLLAKIDAISQSGLTTAQTVQSFVEDTTSSISAFTKTFLTVQGVRDIVRTFTRSVKEKNQNPPEAGKESYGK